jgi:tetratricopeptide (TPR) repeat protein
MKLTAEQYELIEAYLNGKLAPADRADLEAERQADPELDREIHVQEELRAAFRAVGLQNRLQAARQRYEDKPAQSHRPEAKVVPLPAPTVRGAVWGWNNLRTWAAAASVVVVLGVSIWVFTQQSKSPFSETAYVNNYQPDATDFVARSLPGNLKPTERVALTKGIQSYHRGQYGAAIGSLKSVADANGSLAIAQYYLGISYLTTSDVDKAIRYLQAAQRNAPPDLRRRADWYLALAYLKKADRPRTQTSLRVVADDPQSPYRGRAAKLLKQLFR